MDSHIKQLLKEHSLRLTQSRGDIISIFLNREAAVTHSDLEDTMDGKYDRVTIYRTLKSFLDKGLIHKVLDGSGVARYALSETSSGNGHHSHNHIHFKCSICDQTTCLDDVQIPEIELPKGYKEVERNFLVTGVCDKCTV